MEGRALGFRAIRTVAENGHLTVDIESDDCAPVPHTSMRFKSPQSAADGVRVAHEQAKQPERGQCRALSNKEPEMVTTRPVGSQSDQATERGVWDRGPAAVEGPRIKPRLGEQFVQIGAQFDESEVDRLRDSGASQANKRWPLVRLDVSNDRGQALAHN
ncbi:hypothetical protein MEX01_43240 [Methylorubrum extorquens]|nr:hypothetical protein MEX01_43240 [Methylorubrum extorquens]